MMPGFGGDGEDGYVPATGEIPEVVEQDFDPSGTMRLAPTTERTYTVRLTEEERSDLGIRLVRLYEDYRATSDLRRQNEQDWRRDVEMMPSDQPGMFDNASAVRAPFTAWACDQHRTRLNQQILMADPPFQAIARKPEAMDKTPQLEEALTSLLEEADWRSAGRDMHHDLPISGNLLMRVTWRRESRLIPRHLAEFDEETFRMLSEIGVDPRAAAGASVKQDDEGRAKVYFGHEEEVVRDGLELSVIPFRDMVLAPATARSIADCWAIGERLTIRGSDLSEGARSGRYVKSVVDEILEMQGDSGLQDIDEEDTAENQGLEPGGSSRSEARYREYECIELCLYDDLDNDDRMEWYVVAVHLRSRKVFRCQYMMYEHGRAYYVPFRYLVRPKQLFGMSIAERVATIQDAGSAALSNLLDLIEWMTANAGSFFYDERSGLQPGKIELEPGLPIKVDRIEGIMPNRAIEGMHGVIQQILSVLDLLKSYSDLLTATSNPALGRVTDADKTLGEVQLSLSQGMQIFEDYAQGVALSWGEVWDQARYLCAQYASDDRKVRYRKAAAGRNVEFGEIDADVLTADVDLVPAGLSAFADANMRLQQAMALNDIGLRHPLVSGSPEVLLEFLDNLLQAIRYPQRERVTAVLTQAVAAAQQQKAIETQQMVMEQQIAAQLAEATAGGVGGSNGASKL